MKRMRMVWAVLAVSYSLNVLAGNWPAFRGPNGDGLVEGTPQLPLYWSETSNVVWKTEIPHEGWSTPVAQDGRIWLTSATKDGRDYYVYGVDAETGKIILEQKLFHCDEPEPLGNSLNCYAAPTATLESGRVYVHFGSYGTACLDSATGKEIWKRNDLPCRHYRGPGSSAILYEDLLILTFDGVDQQYITALDKRSGKTVWRTDRNVEWKDLDENGQPKLNGDFRKAFATPIVIQSASGAQLICPASSAVFAYNPRTGQEIWKVSHEAHTASVSPVFARGLVIAATGYRATEMLGIKPNGTGDVTDSCVAWRVEGKDVPTTPSPIAVDDLGFMVSNRGAVTCFETETGTTVWRERAGGNHIASPIHSGERVYFFSVTGKATVVRASRTFEKLAQNKLDEGFMASPAVLDNALILRTKTHLYRVEER